MLNATWLDTFVTLTETGHFTHTAERLNMTQPGVSQHLRKLERQVGHALIAQEGTSFTLSGPVAQNRGAAFTGRDHRRRP